jgi:uncharacterized membrane protein YbhN (UPF0104 family)
MQKYFNYFIYISLIFLIWALYKAEYLVTPKIQSKSSLIFAFICLLGGFLFSCLSWQKILLAKGHKISVLNGILSIGLSVFGKYIPGKLWAVVGMAGYIAKQYNVSISELSMISFNAQIVNLWSGLFIGSISILFFFNNWIWFLPFILVFTLLTIAVFTDVFQNMTERIIKIVLKRDFNIPKIYGAKSLSVLPWFIVQWLLWAAGFYLLVDAIVTEQVNPRVAFSYPLAASMGIMAIISPGGLGIREGILTGGLVIEGLQIQEAASISLATRLWFLVGESSLFLFSTGFVIYKNKIKKKLR